MHVCNIAAVFSVCAFSLFYCMARNGSRELILAIGSQSQISNIKSVILCQSDCENMQFKGVKTTSQHLVTLIKMQSATSIIQGFLTNAIKCACNLLIASCLATAALLLILT